MRAAAVIAAVLAAGAALAGGGDPRAGREIYGRCEACHSLAVDRTGPRHCGLLGRRAGSVPGFEYSPAMKASRLAWDERTLDRFLEDPRSAVPGTSMGYAGVKDARERRDLLAFLVAAQSAPPCR